MNVYQKLQEIKCELLKANPKKSGNNKYAGYFYYELADFIPTIIQLCLAHNIMTFVSFTEDKAMLTAVNCEKPEETVTIESPMRKLDLKGCNDIQALGGVETYSRRYLYMAMFDITENDMFDGGDKAPKPEDDKPANDMQKAATRGKESEAPKKPTEPPKPPVDETLTGEEQEKVLKAYEAKNGKVDMSDKISFAGYQAFLKSLNVTKTKDIKRSYLPGIFETLK